MSEMMSSRERNCPVNQDSTQKARSIANGVTLNQLKLLLEQDSAADISAFLEQEAVSYPSRVKELTKSFGPTEKIISTDPPSRVATGLLDLPVDGSVKVTHALDQSVLAIAKVDRNHDAPLGHALKDISLALNQAIRGGEVLFELYSTFVIAISSSIVVKVSDTLDRDHIENIQYLSIHVPNLPIPRNLGVLETGNRTWFFMTRAQGVTLESVWSALDISQKRSVQEQLNGIFQVLRSQPQPESGRGLGSFGSGLCKDIRRMPRVSSGPMRTEAQFNDFLVHEPRRTQTPWIKMIRAFMSDKHRIVMTHGDLHPRNIIVCLADGNESDKVDEEMGKTQKNGKSIRVTSIIDWETAGWYPESWEFVKAVSLVRQRGPLRDWVGFLPTDAIGQYPVEYSIDNLLAQWLG